MSTLNRISSAVCSLSSLLGPSEASCFTKFFDSDNEQSVLLIIEKLLKQGVLSRRSNLIYPPSEKTDASVLFKLYKTKNVESEALKREYVRAVENLIINRSASIRESSLHHFLSSGRLQEVFPDTDEKLFLCTRKFLLKLNLFTTENKNILVDTDVEKTLFTLNRLALAAAVMKNETEEDLSAFLGDTVGFFKNHSTDSSSLKRIVKLYIIKNNCKTNAEDAKSLLLTLKILIPDNGLYHLNRSYLEEETEGSLICDSDFSVTLTSSAPPESRIHIFCDIKSCDRVTEYTLNKSSFFRGLDEGLSSEDILKALGNPPYAEILKTWEEIYSRIRIYSGTVVSVSEDTALLINEIPEIKSSIIRRISDTVFLMSTENYSTWSSRLASAMDMDCLPRAAAEEKKTETVPVFSAVTVPEMEIYAEDSKADCVLRLSDSKDSIEQAFTGLPGKSNSGMDYRGKLTILKEAAKTPSESVLLMEMLDDRTVVARPVELTKAESVDYFLFKNLFTGEQELVKAGSIYSVKLVKLPALH
ncbi:MAG: hypothetical protein K6F82_04230 [Sphaerochaetaceae bacterium]|nr:hypothetical protein [Sphaerochaetaceae bacterium]